MTASQVGDVLGLHHNTVREHLDALAGAGFITATAERNGRRGRPTLLYASTAPDPSLVLDSYLALLDALAQDLGTDEAATRRAHAIGRQWARSVPVSGPDPVAGDEPPTDDERMSWLLLDLAAKGFAPEGTPDGVVLRACPLVTDRRVPDPRVCAMHEGFLNELLQRWDRQSPRPPDPGGRSTITIAPLLPDGCHLHLG